MSRELGVGHHVYKQESCLLFVCNVFSQADSSFGEQNNHFLPLRVDVSYEE